ncbi:probable protein phosphatase 2C 25 [Salvia splendens]|uniref:probable protein phosphatase 2C 25 n=1 Tax=Salvia splendens TaxID=180675 RepID=UPI001C25E2ED|nr:probable protein phosphatase 2C 25 [Salvia splendens]
MHCAVAAVSSPIFTPSPRKMSPVFCKAATAPPPPLSTASSFFFKQIAQPLDNGGGEEEGVAATKAPQVLKRKRPGRIDIPVISLKMEEAKTTSDSDRSNEVVFEGEAYSVYSKRGKRGGDLEDRYAAVLDIHGDSKQAFFGVFDGHGGAGAAEFASTRLEKNIMKEVVKRGDEMEEAVKEGYLATDSEFLKKDIRGGTCCLTALVHKGDLVVSNTGDCRAVMSRGGVAEALTVDHRPSLVEERERIESLGGYVDCCHGVWRVHGSLAVSRAIGDRHLKEWVVAEPETKIFKIRPDCEFLILASDGLWDNVSNQEAVDIIRDLCVGVDKPKTLTACKKLADLSLTRGSLDDISIMVVHLTQFIQ